MNIDDFFKGFLVGGLLEALGMGASDVAEALSREEGARLILILSAHLDQENAHEWQSLVETLPQLATAISKTYEEMTNDEIE